ncbi:raffinose/stachyose/melibiose transport system permease protein [Paenibacillus sp. SORGH_AS306]|uniref:carbohydrate ABC transporter permease n=1 Tax=unclassified Paenibacillus TaxID=185978 RepID=UPI002365CD6A|nr:MULTISPECIES: carbohydrate ABC transporter permease [unclassified Paenibacillus]MDQ1234608.1 raffinose/stachyose/melibiose transport system permease protein [Paenibacillus sp. SORGH_AS_0306]MDR6111653.1 raffinose/stachyose/melibiose transport system permease protein [Paenibacillus sp. SORGH_AS_0338]WDF52663.1 carbohydrate ABC transporter permease [Paenibacillus sp. KACC 21273]
MKSSPYVETTKQQSNVDTRRFFPLGKIMIYAVLCFVAIFYVYPLLWLLLNSLKETPEIYTNPWGLPQHWMWSNYWNAWTTGNTGRYLLNSVWISSATLVAVLVFSAMSAYALTKLRWKLSKATFVYFLLGMMVPIHATLIPLFVYFTKVGLVDSQFGLILIYISFGLPAAVLVLCGFFTGIPKEMLEAAVMDGCTVYSIFWRIVIPISKPALMTVTILSFVGVWNELLLALVFISDPDKLTLPVGLTRFAGEYTTDYAPMFAAIMIATIPTVVLFAVFNKQVLAGMAEGAIKG